MNPFSAPELALGYATSRPAVHPRIIERVRARLGRKFRRALDGHLQKADLINQSAIQCLLGREDLSRGDRVERCRIVLELGAAGNNDFLKAGEHVAKNRLERLTIFFGHRLGEAAHLFQRPRGD